ncbi:MAG: hypothetical protein ACOH2Q_23465 [Rhodococcus sp. (in: high G+C Gram-positive bacteria)]
MKSTALSALAVLLLCAGCGSDEPETFEVTGTVVVDGRVGASGYDCGSIERLDQVRVENGGGDLLGVAELQSPTYDAPPMAGPGEPVKCTFGFSVPEVPAGEKFYEMTVDDVKAGTYSEDEIREPLELA